MDNRPRILFVMCVVAALLMIGAYKEKKQSPIQDIVIKDKIQPTTEIYYKYNLVSGSFLSSQNAEGHKDRLNNLGYQSRILSKTTGEQYHRVILYWSDSYIDVKEYQNIIGEDIPYTWVLIR